MKIPTDPASDPQPSGSRMSDRPPPNYSETGPDAVETVTQQQAEGPPEYSEVPAYGTIDVSEGGMDTKAQLAGEGQLRSGGCGAGC
jgi:hypothetical protein